MKYIELAISKDVSRPNLNHVYRTADGKLVATNGHRIHWSNGLETVTKGHYVDGQDHGEFPDISQVIPQNEAKTAKVKLDIDQLKKLKALLKLVQAFEGKEAGIKISVTGNKLIFSKTKPELIANIEFNGIASDDIFSIYLNLAYFIDAIELPIKEKGTALFTLNFRGELGIFVIESHLGTAAIMPMRL